MDIYDQDSKVRHDFPVDGEELPMATQNAPAGIITDAERDYLAAIVEAINATESRGTGFSSLMKRLSQSMRDLRQYNFDPDEAIHSGVALSVLREVHDDPDTSALTATQTQFLEDIKGLIEYVTRNGIDPNRIWIAITHDVAAIMRNGFSPEQAAMDDSFLPMVSGWAKKNVEIFGDIEE